MYEGGGGINNNKKSNDEILNKLSVNLSHKRERGAKIPDKNGT